MKRPRLLLFAALGILGVNVLALAVVAAQSRLYYFNGIPYTFPTAQGETGQVLTNNGTGGLSWANPVSPEGLWTGAVILSTSTCPSGYTRLSSADERVLRGASTGGGTGGSDTHTHTLSGSTASQSISLSGSTGSSSTSVTGSTGSTDISHTHSVSTSSANVDSGVTSVLTGATVQSGGGSHSHTSGTLSGASHTHAVGTLAAADHSHAVGTLATSTESNLPAYFNVILCKKD